MLDIDRAITCVARWDPMVFMELNTGVNKLENILLFSRGIYFRFVTFGFSLDFLEKSLLINEKKY